MAVQRMTAREHEKDRKTIAALRKSNRQLLAIIDAIRDLFPCREEKLRLGWTEDPPLVPKFVRAQLGTMAGSDLNKSKLILRVAQRHPGHDIRAVECAVDTIFDEIAAAMVRGDRVELRDFGVFFIKKRKAHTGRNPGTGEVGPIRGSARPIFKTARNLYRRLNGESSKAGSDRPPPPACSDPEESSPMDRNEEDRCSERGPPLPGPDTHARNTAAFDMRSLPRSSTPWSFSISVTAE